VKFSRHPFVAMSEPASSPGRSESARRRKSPRDREKKEDKDSKDSKDSNVEKPKRGSSSRHHHGSKEREKADVPPVIPEEGEPPKPTSSIAASPKDSPLVSPKSSAPDRLRVQSTSIAENKMKEDRQKELTATLSDQHIKELKEAFSIFDKNGDGGISVDELRIFLETLGQKPTDKEVQSLMAEVDEDGNNEIDFDEFLQMMVTLLNPHEKEDEIAKALAPFDPKGKGFIKVDDFVAGMTQLGDAMSVKDVNELVAAAAKTSEGHLDFKALVKLLAS